MQLVKKKKGLKFLKSITTEKNINFKHMSRNDFFTLQQKGAHKIVELYNPGENPDLQKVDAYHILEHESDKNSEKSFLFSLRANNSNQVN